MLLKGATGDRQSVGYFSVGGLAYGVNILLFFRNMERLKCRH